MIRRFAAIGDIHAEDQLLAEALQQIASRNVDAVLAVGDIADGRGDVDRCVELLRAHDVTTVRGNHDRWLLEDKMRSLPEVQRREQLRAETLDYLSRLPSTWTADSVIGPLLLCHAVGDDDMTRLQADDDPSVLAEIDALSRVRASGVEVMVCGHTHRPMIRSAFGLLIVNAGTLHHAGHPGFVYVDLERNVGEIVKLDGASETIRFSRDDVWGAF